MLHITKWLRDSLWAIRSAFFTAGRIQHIEHVAPQLKKLVLKVDREKLRLNTGDVVRFRVGNADFRHFAISSLCREEGLLEILIYQHRQGKTARWLELLSEGDEVIMLHNFLSRRRNLRFNPASTSHFMFGDETALGVLRHLREQSDQHEHCYLCLAELDQQHHHWPDLLHLGDTLIVNKSAQHPAREAIDQMTLPGDVFKKRWAEAAFYLSGRWQSVMAFRKALLSMGIPAGNIQVQPYWADHKTGPCR